jgi:hypothetical protein
MYRFVLLQTDDEPYDPPCFVTPDGDHEIGAEIRLGDGGAARILETNTAIPTHLRALGFSGVFRVEPV